MYSPYASYAMGMVYDEECAARDQEFLSWQSRISSVAEIIKNMSLGMNQPMWQPMSPPWSQADNVSCVYCCGAHTYDYCPSNPDSICFEGGYLETSSMNSSYSCSQQSQQVPQQASQSNSIENMLKAYMASNDALIQSQAASLRNLEDQVGQLANELRNQVEELVDEIENQMPGYLPCDTDYHEVIGKENLESVVVESKEEVEVSQTTSVREGYLIN